MVSGFSAERGGGVGGDSVLRTGSTNANRAHALLAAPQPLALEEPPHPHPWTLSPGQVFEMGDRYWLLAGGPRRRTDNAMTKGLICTASSRQTGSPECKHKAKLPVHSQRGCGSVSGVQQMGSGCSRAAPVDGRCSCTNSSETGGVVGGQGPGEDLGRGAEREVRKQPWGSNPGLLRVPKGVSTLQLGASRPARLHGHKAVRKQ